MPDATRFVLEKERSTAKYSVATHFGPFTGLKM